MAIVRALENSRRTHDPSRLVLSGGWRPSRYKSPYNVSYIGLLVLRETTVLQEDK